ncbi:sugar ABC transporter substrate-binding protein [Microbacterium sp. GXF7504]
MKTTTRHSTRWLGAGAALAVGALSLAGCGRADGGGPDAEAGAAIDDSPATGTVDIWAMGNEGELLGEFAEQFMADNPDVTINVTAVPWDGAHDRIATAIAGGQTPDATMLGTTWVGEFAATGAFEPTPDGVADEDSFFEGSFETTEVDDVSYGVPWYVDTRVLYYRTDMAAAAGLEAPTTWDELTAFAAAMTEQGATSGLALPPGGLDSATQLLPFVWQADGDVLEDDAFDFQSQAWKDALTYYDSFFEQGLADDVRLETGEIEQKFIDGEVGAFFSGPYHVSLLQEQGGPEFADKFGIAVVPGIGDERTSFTGGGNLAVFKDSDNRDAAWKFIRWLSQPETQLAWYELSTDLPSTPAAFEDPSLADDPYVTVFGEQLEDAKAPPAIPTWAQIGALIDQEIEQVTRGTKSVDDALADLQQQAESIGTGN